MSRRILALCRALFATFASGAMAQTNDGYVGIYSDPAGLLPCAIVPPQTGTTLYVIAKTAGASANGITGAEFRIEVSNPNGWLMSYAPPLNAALVLGNPLDLSSDPADNSGFTISFATCAVPSAGNVNLGTISVYNLSGTATALLVKRHNRPSNFGAQCPLFVLCDDPVFTTRCMTPSTQDSCALGPPKPAVFTESDRWVFSAWLNAQDDAGGEPPPADPNREVIAMFHRGGVSLPPGATYATLQSVVIASDAVAEVLMQHGVEAVSRTFPNFVLADTAVVTPTGETVRLTDYSQIYSLHVPSEQGRQELVDALSLIAEGVIYAEKNVPTMDVSTTTCDYDDDPECTATIECPDDPRFPHQWNLFNRGQQFNPPSTTGACFVDVDAPRAWRYTKGNQFVRIGIIDTGIQRNHPEFEGRIILATRGIRPIRTSLGRVMAR